MKTLGVIANCGKPRAVDVLRRLSVKARETGMSLLAECDCGGWLEGCRTVDTEALIAQADIIMALGGDGTMLRAVRAIGDRSTPVIGLNIGSLGFLTSISEEELECAIECLAADRHEVARVAVAAATVCRDGREVAGYRGLNDVVISSGASSRVITLDVTIDGDALTSYVCDGLIVSTPCGSTGHCLSAGGPILNPETSALIICLICPHTLSSRPLVVPDQSTIEIRVAHTSATELRLSVDGQVGQGIRQGDIIRVTRSDHDAHLVHLPGYSYFSVLRQKLKWSGSNLTR